MSSTACNSFNSFNFTQRPKNVVLVREILQKTQQRSYTSIWHIYIEKQWKSSALEWKISFSLKSQSHLAPTMQRGNSEQL